MQSVAHHRELQANLLQADLLQADLPQAEDARKAARLHHEGVLLEGSELVFCARTSHRLRCVLRLREGCALRLFNEREGEWLAKLRLLGKSETGAICLRQLRDAAEGREEARGPTLYFSPIRPHRLSVLVSAAVELGVSRLKPFSSLYTRSPFSASRVERMICAAVEQSERLTFPCLLPLRPLQAIAFSEGRVLFCAEVGCAEPIACAVRRWEEGGEMDFGVLIGPEGGFSREEHVALRARSSVCCVSMGNRILRSETAGLAALSCLQASLGDWRRARIEKGDEHER